MVVERSRVNSSHVVPEVGKFVIHPEYLEDEEIEYELRIRREPAIGQRRTLAAKLREIINLEQAGKRDVPLMGYSVPSQELTHCESQIQILGRLLGEVDRDITTQNKFMTKYLHLEGRVNRIPQNRNTHNITNKVFSLNENLSALYNEFYTKITGFRKGRGQRPPNAEEQSLLSQAMGGVNESNKIQSAPEQVPQSNSVVNKPHTINAKTGAMPKQGIAKKLQDNVFDRMYQFPQRKSVPQNTYINANNSDKWVPFQTYNPDLANSDNNISSQIHFVDGISQYPETNNHESFTNYRANANRNPKLSDHFRAGERSLSYIPRQTESEHFPPMASSDINSNLYQIPPENFGQYKRNSMPPLPEQPRNLAHSNARQTYISRRSQNRSPTPSVVDLTSNAPSPDNRVESAIMEMASAVQQLVNRFGSMEVRMNSMEQQQRTFTVNRERPVPLGNMQTNYQSATNVQENVQPRQYPNAYPNASRPNQPLQSQPVDDHSEIDDFVDHGNRVQATDQQTRFRRVPIHKWGFHFTANSKSEIPEEKDARAFLKRLEIFRDAEDVTYGEIFQKFHYLLKGSALNWYTQYRNEFMNWNDLKAGFLKQYTTPLSKFVTAAKLASRKQQRTETASDYIASIIRDFDEMEVHDEEERIAIVQNGLLPDLRNRAMSRDWQSVQEMSIWLRKTETADKLYGQPAQQPFVRKFFTKRPTMAMSSQEGECFEELTEVVEESEQLIEIEENPCNAMGNRRNFVGKRSGQSNATTEAKPKRSVCYNCKSNQHYFNDCDQPVTRVFCFRCGKEDTLAPNCECKKSKNEMVVAGMKVEHCDELSQTPL